MVQNYKQQRKPPSNVGAPSSLALVQSSSPLRVRTNLHRAVEDARPYDAALCRCRVPVLLGLAQPLTIPPPPFGGPPPRLRLRRMSNTREALLTLHRCQVQVSPIFHNGGSKPPPYGIDFHSSLPSATNGSSSLAKKGRRPCAVFSFWWMEVLDSPNIPPQAEYSSIHGKAQPTVGAPAHLAVDESSKSRHLRNLHGSSISLSQPDG